MNRLKLCQNLILRDSVKGMPKNPGFFGDPIRIDDACCSDLLEALKINGISDVTSVIEQMSVRHP